MGYNLQYSYVNCWYCGGHTLQSALKELLGIPYRDAIALSSTFQKHVLEKVSLKNRILVYPKTEALLKSHRSYLKNRGFDPEDIQRLWKIESIGMAPSSNLQHRIVIPIHYHGEVVSWTTRSISKYSNHRYISAKPEQELIDHKSILYGMDFCRHRCIVVEGPLDVWKVGPGAVCTFGTNYSQAQVNKIAMFPQRAICFDGEDTAQKQANRLAHDLSVLPGETTVIELDKGTDPGSLEGNDLKYIQRFLK